MLWEIHGNQGLEIVAKDEFGEMLILVKTGGSHWTFNFPAFGGSGKVRVGDGCNYNPLQMIEAMFGHVVEGIEVPATVEMDEKASYNFNEDWE